MRVVAHGTGQGGNDSGIVDDRREHGGDEAHSKQANLVTRRQQFARHILEPAQLLQPDRHQQQQHQGDQPRVAGLGQHFITADQAQQETGEHAQGKYPRRRPARKHESVDKADE